MDSLVLQLSPSEQGAKTYGLTDVLAKALFSALCECPVKPDINKTLKIVLGFWDPRLFPAQEAVKHIPIMQKTLLL